MRNLKKLAVFSVLSLAMGIAHAAPCNGFEVKIKNNLPDDFLVSKIELQGAELQPSGFQKLNGHSEQVFTVNNSKDDKKMTGTLEFHTISLPSKSVTVRFDLENKTVLCAHDDKGSGGDYPVNKTRLPGQVAYTIG